MTARVVVVLTGLAAAGAAVLIMTTRSADSPPKPHPGVDKNPRSIAPVAERPAGYSQSTAERPSLSVTPGGSSQPLPTLELPGGWVAFEEEVRDPVWASDREREVRSKLDLLLAEGGADLAVADLECRSHQCRFQLGGPEPSFQRMVETLQGDGGFHGEAAELLLQNYQPPADGTAATVQVVLRYGPAADRAGQEP